MSTPITLRIPASSAWVVLARTTATACCARLDFGVDRLEDVRLAVDEVAAMLIADAVPGTEVVCVFTPYEDGGLDIALTAATAAGTLPRTDTFAWAVLTALVDDVTATVDADVVTVLLRTSRSTVAPVEA
ncbi:MAG: anti-sigma regulatory factor [Candidatus Nanopelagicales bacterium]